MLKLPQLLIDKLPTATTNIPMEFLKLGKESYQTDQKSFYDIAYHPSLATQVNNFERHRVAGLVICDMYANKFICFTSGATLYNEDA